MSILWRFILFGAILAIAIAAAVRYGDSLRQYFLGQGTTYAVYVNQVAFAVSVADEPDERKQGLSGTPPLKQYEGKLFIFDEAAKHGIWMKDMLFPIDILWFDDQFTLIHVIENATPDSYPAIFAPPKDARFVLEINAYSAKTLGINVGQQLILPTAILPRDLAKTF